MNTLKKTCFTALILFSLSCTSLKYQIKRNDAFTKKRVSEILKNNDNVFYLGTEYSNASFIWTYTNDFIQVFKIINGTVNTERRYEISNGKDWIIQHSKESYIDQIFDCTELDGDLIEIMILKNGDIEKHSLPVNLECFVHDKYESKFLSKIAEDLKKYNIKL